MAHLLALLQFIDSQKPLPSEPTQACKELDLTEEEKNELGYTKDEKVYESPISLNPIPKEELIVVNGQCHDKTDLRMWIEESKHKTEKPTETQTRTPISWQTLVKLGLSPSDFPYTYGREITKVKFDPEQNEYQAKTAAGVWKRLLGFPQVKITRWPDGTMKSRSTIEGDKKTVENWYENGQLESQTHYKDGKLHGEMKKWYENGKVHEILNFKDGDLHGLYEEWDKDGQLEVQVHYKDDKPHGERKEWYENGQLELQAHYKDGKPHGERKEWYENGKVHKILNLKDGDLHGLYEEWDRDGNLVSRKKFFEGKEVTVPDTRREQVNRRNTAARKEKSKKTKGLRK